MTFRVGQKVVCVDVAGGETFDSGLTLNGIYTLSDVRACPCGCSAPAVWLVEVQCPIPQGYWSGLFRPAVERKTDISFAHEILRKVSDRVRA